MKSMDLSFEKLLNNSIVLPKNMNVRLQHQQSIPAGAQEEGRTTTYRSRACSTQWFSKRADSSSEALWTKQPLTDNGNYFHQPPSDCSYCTVYVEVLPSTTKMRRDIRKYMRWYCRRTGCCFYSSCFHRTWLQFESSRSSMFFGLTHLEFWLLRVSWEKEKERGKATVDRVWTAVCNLSWGGCALFRILESIRPDFEVIYDVSTTCISAAFVADVLGS